ncbi:MAG: HAD-IA family hydrolase [Planctomycetota bacterium]
MARLRAVFLDVGHTLIRPEPSVGVVYARAAERFGARVDPAAIDRVLDEAFRSRVAEAAGRPDRLATSDAEDYAMWKYLTRSLIGRVPGLDVPFEPWFADLFADFGRPGAWRVYPDAFPAIDRFREMGLAVGIVSNWDSRIVPILDGLGIRSRVDAVIFSARVGFKKPHRRIFEEALRRFGGLAPSEALHIGDSETEDLRGAAALGIRALLLDRSGRRPHGPAVVRDLLEAAARARGMSRTGRGHRPRSS